MKANRLKGASKVMSVLGIFRNIAAFIGIFTIAVIVYIYSPPISLVLPVKHIVFIGNRHLTDDELRVLAEVRANQSLVAISNKKVSQKLLKSPWIRSVSVRKELPDTLLLLIEEAIPFALLDMNSHLFIVDDKGKLLEELKGGSIPFLPVITGDPFRESEGLSEAIKLAKLMNSKGFSSERDQIEIFAGKPHELTVTIDGTIVKMGSGKYEEKLERLIAIEDELKNRGIPLDYIDLRFENRAIVKPIAGKVVK